MQIDQSADELLADLIRQREIRTGRTVDTWTVADWKQAALTLAGTVLQIANFSFARIAALQGASRQQAQLLAKHLPKTSTKSPNKPPEYGLYFAPGTYKREEREKRKRGRPPSDETLFKRFSKKFARARGRPPKHDYLGIEALIEKAKGEMTTGKRKANGHFTDTAVIEYLADKLESPLRRAVFIKNTKKIVSRARANSRHSQ